MKTEFNKLLGISKVKVYALCLNNSSYIWMNLYLSIYLPNQISHASELPNKEGGGIFFFFIVLVLSERLNPTHHKLDKCLTAKRQRLPFFYKF